jgi:hypothetical protein
LSAPYDRILCVDFETRWDSKDYTLSKMTTEEYIRDVRFKAFGCCFHEYGSDDPIVWVGGRDLPEYVDGIDWSRTALLAHNAQFDVSILCWRYGVRPAFIFDTLSMARAMRGVEVGNSLARLATDFGLPEKGRAVHSTNGLSELGPEIESELADYCKHDVVLCEEIFARLIQGYPAKELRLIDMTLRMYTNACLELDREMLIKALSEEGEKREGLLKKLDVEETALASNDKFAQVLTAMGVTPPTKISKTTGKEAFAFAKNDALFQALLNGEREDVALLCEARLRVKSTTERTRAQRFLDISGRGPLPVPLSYYGAATGRWTAAKGSAINMQNLKRGSFLRKAIMAPVGHQLVVGDLSQIEPRVLAWFADYEDMLDIFRSGSDAYAAFGAQMFNIPGLSKESHPDLRQSAKSALLGCFGPETLVLTNRGWLPIVQVQATDTVWDGEEWVCHQGVVPQGEKEVLTALGISATSDHEILTEHGWAEWSEVLANLSLLKPAMSLANSLALAGSAVLTDPSGKASSTISPRCAAPADGKVLLSELIFGADEQRGATTAQRKKQPLLGWLHSALKRCAQMLRTASACSPALAPSSAGAPTPTTLPTQTTAGAASRYTLCGYRTALRFCATLLDSMAGMCLHYNSTAATTTEGTNRATYGSSPEAKTCRTNARSKRVTWKGSSWSCDALKQRMQTYDIAYAGPRNSYTILTSEGPLIVHNCGYGLGWASFASQLLVGFLGAPPVRYDKAFAKKLGVDAAYIDRFVGWDENVKKLREIPHTCTERELLIHCVAAKKIIDIYRSTAHPVVSFWDMCSKLMEKSLYGGEEVVYKCVTFRKEEIVLPSGMSLKYPNLRNEVDKETKQRNWVYGEAGVKPTKLYAGKITNNIVQGTARVVMTDGMLRVDKKYPVVGTVHDELLCVVPDDEVEGAKDWVLEQMIAQPKYMPGIPLNSEVGAHRRYGLAKG